MEAIRLAESYKKSHVAIVLGGALGEVKPLIADGSVTVADINSAERAVERNMLLEITNLKRGLAVLATVGATAPFVGLLGTTMGVVNSFTGMAQSGSGGLAAIGGGIAEALITTAFGLLVAIPAVWLYNYFINRIDYISMEITYATKEFMDFLLKYEARLSQGLGKETNVGLMEAHSASGDAAAAARSSCGRSMPATRPGRACSATFLLIRSKYRR